MEESRNVPKLTTSMIKLLVNVNNVVTCVYPVVLRMYVLNVQPYSEITINQTDNAFLNVQLVNCQCRIKYANLAYKTVMLVLPLQPAIVATHLPCCYLLLANV